MSSPRADWRAALAARLEVATGLPAHAGPPPSITPPCVVLLLAGNYPGPRTGACATAATVTVRLVTDVHEHEAAWNDLDELVDAALAVLPGYEDGSIGARTYGESRYWCADLVVTETAGLPAPTRVRDRTPT